jgi:hypothetical protein
MLPIYYKTWGCPESRILDFWMPLFTFQNLDISTFLIIKFLGISTFRTALELFTENQKLIITSGLPSLFSFIVLHEKNEKRVHFC